MSTTSVPAKAANGQPPLEVDGTVVLPTVLDGMSTVREGSS